MEEDDLGITDGEIDLIFSKKENGIVFLEDEDDLGITDEEVDLIFSKKEKDVVFEEEEDDLGITDGEIDLIFSKKEKEVIFEEEEDDLGITNAEIDLIFSKKENFEEEEDDLGITDGEIDLIFFKKENDIVSDEEDDLGITDGEIDLIFSKKEKDVIFEEEEDDLGITDGEIDLLFSKKEKAFIYVEEEVEKSSSGAKIKMEIGRFRELPKSNLPQEAFEMRGAQCQVLGIDTNGFLFIGFPQQLYEIIHIDEMAQLNKMYRNIRDLRDLSIIGQEIEVGEILVGKTITRVNGELEQIFLRVQIIDVGGDMVTAVDIDDQKMLKFRHTELYWMLDHYYRIPMRGVKCCLLGLEEFVGTSIISDALRSCETADFKMVVKVTEDIDELGVPKVQLYQSQFELETGVWSFNHDVMEIIKTWNAAPFYFTGDMVLLDTRITHANSSGVVFVQFQSALMNELSNIRPLEDLSTVDPDHILNSVKALLSLRTPQEMFLKKVDGQFRRVLVPQSKHRSAKSYRKEGSFGSVQLTHVDYGIPDIGNLRELVPFSYFPEILETVPPQGFHAVLQQTQTQRGLILTPEAIDRLISTPDIKIAFNGTPMPCDEPTIIVYFPKKENKINPLHLRQQQLSMMMENRPERPDSQSSSASSSINSGMSSSNYSCITRPDPRKKYGYQRFLLPVVDPYRKVLGYQFEYNYDQKWVQSRHNHHVQELNYSPLRTRNY